MLPNDAADHKANRPGRRVLLWDHAGRGNLGDDLMRQGLRRLLSTTAWDVRFVGGPEGKAGSDSNGRTNLFGGLRHCQELWFGPGTMLHDHGSRLRFRFSGFFRLLLAVLLCRLGGKTLRGVGLGIGPMRSSFARILWRLASPSFQWVSVRDAPSAAFLPPTTPCLIAADPALALPFPPWRPQQEPPLLGLCIAPAQTILHGRPQLDRDQAAKLEHALLTFARTHPGLRLEWLVGSRKRSEGDLAFCRHLRDRCQQAGLPGELLPCAGDEVLECMSRWRAVVSVRYHGLLLGWGLGMPAVSLSYHPKCDRLAEEGGLHPGLRLSWPQFSADQLQQSLCQAWSMEHGAWANCPPGLDNRPDPADPRKPSAHSARLHALLPAWPS